MENNVNITKGELMEELLRKYFLNSGFYVVRGVKYKYENLDITDVDLFLYSRSSNLTRQRLNVDIKNKKTPQAFERILWANGLRKLLNFDSCIVATTDHRPIIQTFGQLHKTTILDGSFLSKLRSSKSIPDRLTEEQLTGRFARFKSYKTFPNKDWRLIYESSKSKLLIELDFSGFNSILIYLEYFIGKVIADGQKREDATRMVYLLISHLLIIIDFITKDIAFLEPNDKGKKLLNGFKFGNLGEEGVEKIIDIAIKISGNASAGSFIKSLTNEPVDILRDFFGRNEVYRNLFNWAKEFEKLGYNIRFIDPMSIDPQLKGVLSIFLDFFKIERRSFFDIEPKNIQTALPFSQ